MSQCEESKTSIENLPRKEQEKETRKKIKGRDPSKIKREER